MRSFWERFEHFVFGHPEYVNLNQRFIHIVCLGGGIASLVSIPLNFYVVTGWTLTVSNIIETFILFGAYLYSRLTGHFHRVAWITLLSLLAFLSLQWFFNSGSTGGAQYYFMILALIASAVFSRWEKYLYISISMITIISLIAFEFIHPELILTYDSKESRTIDVAFSISLTIFLIGVSVSVLSNHNQTLLKRIERKTTELKEDLKIARLLQEEVFRITNEHTHSHDFSMLYMPSMDVGGDLYDISPIENGLRILLADMKGHGVNAALSAMLVKTEWSHSGHISMDPAEALSSLNSQLIDRYNDSINLSACVADIYKDRIVFSAGGCPPQFITDRKSVISMNASGPLLGLMDDVTYVKEEHPISPYARLFLYSDALIEEYSQLGEFADFSWLQEQLIRSFNGSEDLLQSVMQKFSARTGKLPGQTTDDLTVIVVGNRNSV